MEPISFWFSIGSTYTYLSLMRLPEVARRTGATFDLRPFSLRAITREMNNIPFSTKPIKARYMWRDIERRAGRYGFEAKVPAPYPLPQLDLANRVAIVGRQEGWCEAYAMETYKRWFQAGEPPGEEPNLSGCLTAIGQQPEHIVERAASPEIESAYHAATDEARALEIFGAPTFVVGRERFWGDDRLEDAIAWAQRSQPGNAA